MYFRVWMNSPNQSIELSATDEYASKNNIEEFLLEISKLIFHIRPEDYKIYGIYSPFYDERPVYDNLLDLHKKALFFECNLVVEIEKEIDICRLFSETLYFSSQFYLIISQDGINSITLPFVPKPGFIYRSSEELYRSYISYYPLLLIVDKFDMYMEIYSQFFSVETLLSKIIQWNRR